MLPYLDNEQLVKMINNGDKLIIANDIVYKINNYHSLHPGGNCILKRVLTIDSNNPNRIIVDLCDRDYNFHSKNSKKFGKIWLLELLEKNVYGIIFFLFFYKI